MHPTIQYKEFWTISNKQYQISRIDISQSANDIGFCLYKGELYKIIGKFIYPSTERDLQDTLKHLVDPEIPEYGKIINAYEAFMQKNGKYMMSRLQIIARNHFLNDARNSCYKFFKSGYIKIMADKIFYREYKNFPKNKYILSTKIQPREFRINPEGKYIDFLSKATAWGQNIKQIIGYLCHEYKDETTGYIIVLTEQCPDPKEGGGSGKNLFCNLLSHSTSYHSKNGAQVKFDEKFFQSWNGQRLMGISDVPKNFSYEFLKEPSTGTFILKKLYKNEEEVHVQDGPKFIIQTNYSYTVSDGGLNRRIIPIEFTDFFTRAGGIDVFFGCHFPSGWKKEDWCNYDTVIASSIQEWLSCGLKLTPTTLSETGWNKQFEHSYGKNLADFIRDNFEKWKTIKEVPSKDVHEALKTYYIDNNTAKTAQHNPQRVASAIKEYSKHYKVMCTPNKQVEINTINTKCYLFSCKE